MNRQEIMYLSQPEYDWYGLEKGWNTNVIYQDEMSKKTLYFHSPDGVGRIWHDTLKEMYEFVFEPSASIVIVRKKEYR